MRRNHEQCDRKALGASRQAQLAIIHASKKMLTLPIYELRTGVSVIYIYIYICMCVCVRIYIHTHTHTYIALFKIP